MKSCFKLVAIIMIICIIFAATIPTVAGDMGQEALYTTVVASNSRFVPQVATIKNDGTLWISGADVSTIVDEYFDADQCYSEEFMYMEDVVNISAGYSFSAAIKTDGSLWMWGSNIYGELGNGSDIVGVPEEAILQDVADVSCGEFFTVALKNDGTVWTWGANYSAQLGNGTISGVYQRNPTPVQIMDGVVAIAAGDDHAAAIKTDGSLWMWGLNDLGQLGNGTNNAAPSPIQIIESGVMAVSCGDAHTLIIKDDFSLWGWGDNHYGQLGDGTNTGKLSPIHIMDNVSVMSAGNWCSGAVTRLGELYTWGRNSWGQLGIGNKSDKNTPQFITNDIVTVSCGGGYTAILKTDGSVWTCGYNRYGQLGDGTETDRTKFVLSREDVRMPGISGDDMLLGDANGDRAVNIGDVSFILRCLIHLETIDSVNEQSADFNSDGRINSGDAASLLKELAQSLT